MNISGSFFGSHVGAVSCSFSKFSLLAEGPVGVREARRICSKMHAPRLLELVEFHF